MQNGNFLTIRIEDGQSQLIKIARVVCIVFMMTTHIWPGSDRILVASQPFPIEAFFFLVVDSFGRASVPLLSLISGLLIVHSFDRRPVWDVEKSKPATLLVPMIVWSIPMILLAFAESQIRSDPGLVPGTTMEWINSLFAITQAPANGPLHFLREIFIMSVYAAIVMLVYRAQARLAWLLMFAIFLLEQIPGGFLLFRNQIATFYLVGMAIALTGHARWVPSWKLVGAALLVHAAILLWGISATADENFIAFRILEHVPRIAMSLLMWRLCYELVTRPNRLAAPIMAIEPHIFTIFCSHIITVKFFGGLAYVFKWDESDPFYLAVFLIQIPVCIVVGIIASKLLTPFPWLRGKYRKS